MNQITKTVNVSVTPKEVCDHKDGWLNEYMWAQHSRRVYDGMVDGEGINEMGDVTHYEYVCLKCKKAWRLSTLNPEITKMPKWLASIIETF